jgi:hypothetical protein
VTQLLGNLPAGARVAVLGITSESFAQPYVILQAHLSADPGYFGEKLAAGMRQIVLAWKKRSARLQPRFSRTDILGALMLVSALFAEHPDAQKRVLVLYSDMRKDTPDLELESERALHLSTALGKVQQRHFLVDLRGIDVYVLGADAAGEQVARWQELRAFWEGYFNRTRAHLKAYSVFRGERVPWP